MSKMNTFAFPVYTLLFVLIPRTGPNSVSTLTLNPQTYIKTLVWDSG